MCLSHALVFFKHFLTCVFFSGSLSSSHVQQVDEGRDHLLSHALPPSTQEQLWCSHSPPTHHHLSEGRPTHIMGRTRKKIHTPIPEGHQCLVMESSGTHSVGAPQTYSVKCSQGLKKYSGMKKMSCHWREWRKSSAILMIIMVTEECHNCRGRVGILKSMEYISDCLHFALSSPHTCTPTHQHVPHLSPSPNSETLKLSRRRRRRARLFVWSHYHFLANSLRVGQIPLK